MPFRFDKLTIKAQEAVQNAQELAGQRGHPQIDALHLLAALVAERDGVFGAILDKIGANRAQLQKIVEAELGHFPCASGGAPPQPAASLVQVFEASAREAEAMKDEFISVEHLFLALTKVDTKARSLLKLNAISEEQVLQALRTVRG
ncbi:MAG TPA: Clp protease N-terminal domain-containing protein, partial [Pirellulales bacterium]|nr:Clp protease N-terminal domain-containing protein [Pirellulales bacterium]